MCIYLPKNEPSNCDSDIMTESDSYDDNNLQNYELYERYTGQEESKTF